MTLVRCLSRAISGDEQYNKGNTARSWSPTSPHRTPTTLGQRAVLLIRISVWEEEHKEWTLINQFLLLVKFSEACQLGLVEEPGAPGENHRLTCPKSLATFLHSKARIRTRALVRDSNTLDHAANRASPEIKAWLCKFRLSHQRTFMKIFEGEILMRYQPILLIQMVKFRA